MNNNRNSKNVGVGVVDQEKTGGMEAQIECVRRTLSLKRRSRTSYYIVTNHIYDSAISVLPYSHLIK